MWRKPLKTITDKLPAYPDSDDTILMVDVIKEIESLFESKFAELIADAREIMKSESPGNPHAGAYQERELKNKWL